MVEGKMIGESYVQLLSTNLKPAAQKIGLRDNFNCQPDNDSKHTSRVAKEYFVPKSIELLPRPAENRNSNPIDHLWQYLDDKIDRFSCRSNKREFVKRLKDSWEIIPQSSLQNLIDLDVFWL